MGYSQWRKFNFFERDLMKDPDTKQDFSSLKGITITSASSGSGKLLVGDSQGYLHLLNRDLQLTSFQINKIKVSHLFQLKQNEVLVSIGNDEVGINPLIQVWNFHKLDKKGNPTLVSRAPVTGTKPSEVTCLSVHENLTQMAVGFDDGTVVVFKGDIMNSRSSKQRTIHMDKYPITGLAYKQYGNSVILFVTTTKCVFSYNVTSSDKKEILEEDFGASFDCSAINDASTENQFVVATDDGLHFYHPEGKRACLAFDGEKKMVSWFRGYLVVVSKEMKQLPKTAGTGLSMNILTVYDINNSFIAYSAPFPDVVAVLTEWSCLHVLSSDGKIFQLVEKDTKTKLEILFRKNMYDMAIRLAKSQQYAEGLYDIFKYYGDHLYQKRDHDGAMQQYIRTIGHLEPSYVIKNFLDAQRIHNLTDYLQALHEKGLANTDHTTLLINCYTKLKAVDKLDGFINTDKELNFDVETAIKVCRQAGYFEHALQLAEKKKQHEWYIKIQLEDIKDYEKALKYMHMLPFQEAESNLRKYGKTLVNNETEKTTAFLKELCTNYQQINAEASLNQVVQRAYPVDFIHIFVHEKSKLKDFLEYIVKMRNDCSETIYNTLLELYLHDATMFHAQKNIEKAKEEEQKALDLLIGSESKYDFDHAMVLAQMNSFKRGILYLYEKAKSFQQILHYHMENKEYNNIISDCNKYGDKDISLWSQALSYFAEREDECKTHIAQVLNHIEERKLLSPLEVIQELSQNSTASLGIVKDYIIRQLQQENELISKAESSIKKHKEDSKKMEAEIEVLKTSAKIFQSSKCMICNRLLELPAVHFLCGDSFHQTCFESYSDSENECPICAPENRKIKEIIYAHEHNNALHEQFNQQLERSSDGFSVVADYFGRGVFKKVTIYTDMKTQLPILQNNISD
ncbi:vacuolar protein sorting-associated protein 11 homolog [Hydra vulgaris]|uniref:Vacuolar protein sorting-associated protein 11 homolog n=1 Tax=Hydra vulgaris TaxID=6087 RepID=A0ABM4BW33_HYDVU